MAAEHGSNELVHVKWTQLLPVLPLDGSGYSGSSRSSRVESSKSVGLQLKKQTVKKAKRCALKIVSRTGARSDSLVNKNEYSSIPRVVSVASPNRINFGQVEMPIVYT